jgi:uncharacterized protein (TIGR03083 family)
MTLDAGEYVRQLRADGAALAAAARRNLDAPVPSCPGWTVGDLVFHTGAVHRDKTLIVRERLRARPDVKIREPGDDRLVEWFEEGLEELARVLEASDPDQPVWNWSSRAPQTVSFWPRRMAHETSVHRWDAQAAVGTPLPIDSDLAADGVDEFFDVHMPDEESAPPLEGTVHLHRTDGPGEWFVQLDDSGARVTKEHKKGDAAIRAPASDLVLLLWRRIGLDDVEVFGDKAVAERFVGWVDLN